MKRVAAHLSIPLSKTNRQSKLSPWVQVLVLFVAGVLASGCAGSNPPPPGGPTITATAGATQSATVSTAFATNLQATVKDSKGNPVANLQVTFTVQVGSGAGGTFAGGTSSASATTNANGVATAPPFTANGTAGNYVVSANATGVAAPAVFNLTNTAGAPATITATAGTPQSAAINTAFATSLQATVKDSNGNVVASAQVTFTVVPGAPGASGTPSGTFVGGTTSVSAATTASGLVTATTLTANATIGSFTVNATVNGAAAPAVFNLTNNAGAPATITPTAGTLQSAMVGTAFATLLQATVKDSGGNPVVGAQVTFTAPAASGASGTFANGTASVAVATNGSGVATAATFTANASPGSYVVNATVSGLSTPAVFNLTNTPATPATIMATSGTPQSALINAAFATPLQATVKDGKGNLIVGAQITFTAVAAANAASGTFANGTASVSVMTNSNGVAIATTFTANGTAGTYVVNATVPGVAAPAVFNLTNLSENVTATAGTLQSALVNTAFATNLQATVKDSNGNVVVGAQVTFTAPSTGASGAFANGTASVTVTTNSVGIAIATTFTANGTAGSYAVNATVAGVATPAVFNLANIVAGPPASIAATAGTPQSTAVNTVFATLLQATVKDSNGNAVANSQVTFTVVPGATGASGTFSGGATSVSATTTASGVATATTLTANATVGSFTVNATVSGVAAPAVFNLTNTANTYQLACPLPLQGSESKMSSEFTFLFDGWDDANGPYQAAGAFAADGKGNIVDTNTLRTAINGQGGEIDLGTALGGVATAQPEQINPTVNSKLSSCYNLDSTGRGYIILNYGPPPGTNIIFSYSLVGASSQGRLIRVDDDPTGSGKRGSGFFSRQGATSPPSPPTGALVFSVTGYTQASNNAYLRNGMLGECCLTTGSTSGLAEVAVTNTTGGASNGTQSNFDQVPLTLAVNPQPKPSTDPWGRGTLTINFPSYPQSSGGSAQTFNYAYYGYSGPCCGFVIQSTDTPGTVVPLSNGQLINANAFGFVGTGAFFATGADLSANQGFTVSVAGLTNIPSVGTAFVDEISNGSALYANQLMVPTYTCWGGIGIGGCLSGPMGTITLTPNPASSGTPLTFTAAQFGNGAFLLEGTQAAPGTNLLMGEEFPQAVPGSGFGNSTINGKQFGIGTLYPASTHSTVTVGAATATGGSPAPPMPPPPIDFSGAEDSSLGLGCAAGCVVRGNPVAAQYSIDLHGRITFNFGQGVIPGWLFGATDGVFLDLPTTVNSTVTFFGQTLNP